MKHLLVIVLLLVAVPALAGPSKADRKRAEAHFKQGKAFFDSGQWQSAIDAYEQAWTIDPEPVLQFNIALAYEAKGDLEEAYARYQKYLELDPEGPVADEASEDIARLKAQVDAVVREREAAAAKAKAEADAQAKAEAEAAAQAKAEADAQAKAEADAQAKAEADARAAAEREREEQARNQRRARARKKARPFTWGGIGAGALGVVAVGVGVSYGLDARAASNELTGHTSGPWTDDLLARDAAGQAADRNLMIFSISGGALVLGGAALWYVGHHIAEHF